jgi:hypothetical protein
LALTKSIADIISQVYNIQNMVSYCYTPDINKELGESNVESYETKNRMKAIRVNAHEAIDYNKKTMATSDKKACLLNAVFFIKAYR